MQNITNIAVMKSPEPASCPDTNPERIPCLPTWLGGQIKPTSKFGTSCEPILKTFINERNLINEDHFTHIYEFTVHMKKSFLISNLLYLYRV